MPRVLSLFAGIGGFDLGLERAGFACASQVELDPFCQRVLAARWPGVERAADVRGVARELGGQRDEGGSRPGITERCEPFLPVDLLVGGFPCQDLSVAGKRAGLGGERSGLFWEIVRIAHATRPTWGLFENVPGLVSSHRGSDMALVIQGLRECWPVVGWRILDSRYFGVAQRRRRVFFVCGPTESGVAQVLALTEGGEGDSAPGGEAGARVADTTVFSTLNSGGNDGGFRTEPGEHLTVFKENMSTPSWGEDIAETLHFHAVAHSLSAEGHDASEDGTGRGTPLVPVCPGGDTSKSYWKPTDQANTLTATDLPWQGTRIAYQNASVRRLTPLECERLQGFPDGWSCLCQPLEAYAEDPDAAALRCTCPDSPRYRALGNAVTVSVIEWLGRRLMRVIA